MAAYRLTPQARGGLRKILKYVEREFGVRLAEHVLDQLESAFERLAENPAIGHSRGDLAQDERIQFWSVGPTLIAYRSDGDDLEVLFVERGERDWEQFLSEE